MKNLLIIGSTGGTGRNLVDQGLRHGYTITAFARTPEKMDLQHENLSIVEGDVLDYASVEAAVQGKDAVLSALGVASLGKNTVLSEGTKHLIQAMEQHRVRRFVCETSLGVGDSKGQLGLLYDLIVVPLILRNAIADKEVQEQYIRESALDWIIVRPGGLTDGPLTGTYYAWTGKRQQAIKSSISRADVADFMLKQVEDDTYLRQAVGLSY